jgi:hypothetical protein
MHKKKITLFLGIISMVAKAQSIGMHFRILQGKAMILLSSRAMNKELSIKVLFLKMANLTLVFQKNMLLIMV